MGAGRRGSTRTTPTASRISAHRSASRAPRAIASSTARRARQIADPRQTLRLRCADRRPDIQQRRAGHRPLSDQVLTARTERLESRKYDTSPHDLGSSTFSLIQFHTILPVYSGKSSPAARATGAYLSFHIYPLNTYKDDQVPAARKWKTPHPMTRCRKYRPVDARTDASEPGGSALSE